eukprot:3650707-Ditylum_brightwellii.AAC.1
MEDYLEDNPDDNLTAPTTADSYSSGTQSRTSSSMYDEKPPIAAPATTVTYSPRTHSKLSPSAMYDEVPPSIVSPLSSAAPSSNEE